MQQHVIQIILIVLTSVSSLTTLYLLIKINKVEIRPIVHYKFSRQSLKNKAAVTNLAKFMLDPHEFKILSSLITEVKSEGLSVSDINELLNLNKLSKENQRQRRHIIFKELNLKLFLVLGVRESIVRVSSEMDKRIKYYTLDQKSLDVEKLKSITESHL